ncbi:MAG: enoyl-CoA hydratase [Robiginitomaculum sp.]|nr:MAG: enoyl-CoA hydratase [Robiginitomaculum sp.]
MKGLERVMEHDDKSAILIERDENIGWITLNRPGQINAINDAIRHGFPKAIAQLDADPSIKVIVVRSSGDRGFCVGADIKEKRPTEDAIDVRQRMEATRWIESIDNVQKPVIAAIHGYCLGGGLELAMACDIRFAAPSATFALPEVGLGLIPGGGGTQRITRLIGLSRAMDFLLSGERISAVDAKHIGLITRISGENEALLEDVRSFAQHIATKPARALIYAKKALKIAGDTDLTTGLDTELDLFALLAVTKERKAAALAFENK